MMKLYALIVAISLLPFLSFFLTNDIPHTHDGPVHLARMAAYYKAITAGQFLPRWASDLNFGYGMPLYNFIYHTPYLLSVPFIWAGLGLVNTFKIVITLSFVLSGIGMFLFAREFWKDDKTAILVTLFYQFAPFRLAETHIRGSFGEVFTYAALPFVLYGITKNNILITSIFGTLLILSHNSISLLFFAIAAGFAVVTRKRFSGLFLAIALSATYWLPALLERKYTYGDLFMKDIYKDHFVGLWQLASPSLVGGVPVQIGLFHILALIAALFTRKKLTTYIVVLTGVAIFFMQPVSSFIWQNFALLRQFQFPWRFLSVVVVATSLAAGFLATTRLVRSTQVYLAMLFLLVITTAWYWNPPLGFDKITNENDYWNFKLNTTYYGETDVIWSAGPHKLEAPSQIELASGMAIVNDIQKQSTAHTFNVNAQENVTIVDNTQYFPGWRAFVDGKQVPIEFQDINWRGLITFKVAPGQHSVKVAFGRTPVRLVADLLSLSGLLFISFIWLKRKYFSH